MHNNRRLTPLTNTSPAKNSSSEKGKRSCVYSFHFYIFIYRITYYIVIYYLSLVDLWQECEFQSPKEEGSSSKHSTPGRRGKFKSRPVSRNVKTTNKVLKRSKSANTSIQNGMELNKQTSLTEVAPTKELEAHSALPVKLQLSIRQDSEKAHL